METAEVGLGFVTAYNPNNATIDIRTIDGTPYPGLPFDANLAFYSTPVLPILRTEPSTGAIKTVKLGSCVLFAKFSDSNLRIIRIFNDDQDIVKNIAGQTNQTARAIVRDTLLAMLQDGEALVSAPGRIIETSPQVFERQAGSWLLLKNSGDAILSNADSSCEVWVSYTGQYEVSSTRYRLRGVDTRVQEDDAGSLIIASGENRGSPVVFTLSRDATAQLTSGASSMVMTSGEYSISSGTVNISGGNEVSLSAANLNLSSAVLNVGTENANVNVSETLTVAAKDVAASASNDLSAAATKNLNVTAGATLSAAASQAIMINAPKNAVTIDATGTKITIDEAAKLTIAIGQTSLEVSKDGIKLLPPFGKAITCGSSPVQVLLGDATAAAAIASVCSATVTSSTVLKASVS